MYSRIKSIVLPQKPPEDKHPPSNVDITIIDRERWFGLPPKVAQLHIMPEPHKQVCFVSTETLPCEDNEECVREVQEIQKRNVTYKNWPDMPFNFLIGGDGLVYEGRGFQMKYSDHGNPAMGDVLQVAYIGRYKDCDPPKEMVELGARLIEYGQQRKYISDDYTYVECPLSEYYKMASSAEEFWSGPAYAEFLETVPPPPPPKPDA